MIVGLGRRRKEQQPLLSERDDATVKSVHDASNDLFDDAKLGRKNILPIVIAVIGMCLIVTVAMKVAAPKVQAHLRRDVERNVLNRVPGVSVRFDGRDAILEGAVNSPSDVAAIRDAVSHRWGVRTVDVRTLSTRIPAPPTTVTTTSVTSTSATTTSVAPSAVPTVLPGLPTVAPTASLVPTTTAAKTTLTRPTTTRLLATTTRATTTTVAVTTATLKPTTTTRAPNTNTTQAATSTTRPVTTTSVSVTTTTELSPAIAESSISQLLVSAPLQFDQGSSTLGIANLTTMERLAVILAAAPKARFGIVVVDTAADRSIDLDRRRATYIRSSLSARGISSARLVVQDADDAAVASGTASGLPLVVTFVPLP
jgi:hypothetical protein